MSGDENKSSSTSLPANVDLTQLFHTLLSVLETRQCPTDTLPLLKPGDDFDLWHSQAKVHLPSVAAKERSRYICRHLSTEALSKASSFGVKFDDDFDSLLDSLRRVFATPKPPVDAYRQFSSRLQLPGESARDYLGRLRPLVLAAFPDSPSSTTDDLLFAHFRAGILDDHLRRKLIKRKSLPPTELLSLVQDYEDRYGPSLTSPCFAVSFGQSSEARPVATRSVATQTYRNFTRPSRGRQVSVAQISTMFTPVFAFLTVTIISYLVWRWFNRPHCVDIRNRHVLITGGSSGIGLALAREAAKRGAYVTIVARNKTRLSKAKEELSEFAEDASKISTLSMDLCGPFEEIKKCLESNIDVVDILIHCAGFAVAKTFLSTPAEAFDEQMAVSYLGPAHVTKVLLPKMLIPAADGSVQPKDRRIAFFSSIGGQLSIYGYSGYAASKFAIRGFAGVLRQELEPTGILVTTVYPPDTDTPGFANENKDKPHVTEIISGPAGLWSPDVVAAYVMHDILVGRAESVQGVVGWAILLATSGISLPHESMLGPVLAGLLELLLAQPLKLLSMLGAVWMRWVIMHYAPRHDTPHVSQTGDE